ncbi:MAG: GNAT family N-acetyltransferase [Prevotellaceae bacterium]|nr:GNAT family N-acetyltransferase [Prevotellaceae bacterium]
MYKIKRYTSDDKSRWDEFVEASKNGTFILKRDFMEYHSDRFTDHSLLFFDDKDKLVALLPANEVQDSQSPSLRGGIRRGQLHSHQGLTYGGLVLSSKQGINEVMGMFDSIIDYLKANNFTTFHYKQVPTIYHRCPSQEDEYALWRHNAVIEVCNIASTMPLHSPQTPAPKRDRMQRFKKACTMRYRLDETYDLSVFWPILETSLALHHDAKPVHTLEEMARLKALFPDNIKCYIAYNTAGEAEGGVLLFVTDQVAHSQYGHATEVGYSNHVMDYIYQTLIEKYRNDGHTLYFDLGTSNEDGGHVLNASLAHQKEGFGARGIAYKQWRINIE